jgi:diacylglycerol kinase family enzyme
MRVTLLHNPTAGDDPAPADELVRELGWAGFDVAYVAVSEGELDPPEDLGEMVVIAGGDGTVRKVAKWVAGRGVPLAILPVGTANNVARSFGQVGSLRQLVAGWREGVRTTLDVGVVRAPWGRELFLEAFGGGAFASMLASGLGRRVPDRAGFAGNRIDRGLQMFCEAIRAQQCQRWCLRLDDEEIVGEFLFVEVMNVHCLGPNVPLAPTADPSDGYFDLLLATEDDRAALLDYAERRLQGHHASCPRIAVRRGRRLRAEPGTGPVHVDDRLWTAVHEHDGDRAFEVEIDHGALQVIVGAATSGTRAAAPSSLSA